MPNFLSFTKRQTDHPDHARNAVFLKGLVDLLLSVSLVLAPSLLMEGRVAAFVSQMTGLAQLPLEPGATFVLASFLMSFAVVELTSATAASHKTIATICGMFAIMGLSGCVLSPHKFGSSFLLTASSMELGWSISIIHAGDYGIVETLGLTNLRERTRKFFKSRMAKRGDHSGNGHNVSKKEEHVGRGEEKEGYADVAKKNVDSVEDQGDMGAKTRGRGLQKDGLGSVQRAGEHAQN